MADAQPRLASPPVPVPAALRRGIHPRAIVIVALVTTVAGLMTSALAAGANTTSGSTGAVSVDKRSNTARPLDRIVRRPRAHRSRQLSQRARRRASTRARTHVVERVSPYGDRVGFASHTNYLPEAEGGAYLERATSIGVRWFREDFWWSALEPRRGEFDWSATDALMRNASRYDANIVAIAGYAPGWASGHTESDKFPPRDPGDYARFCVEIVNRYGHGGSFWAENPGLRPAPIRAIELWNEPWFWRFWGPDPSPAAYASLVRAAAPAIKAARAEVKVLISGDLHVGYRDGRENSWLNGWLSQLLRQDLPMSAVDGWSIHPYSGNRGPHEATITGFADQTYAQQWLFQQLPLIRDMTVAAGKFKPLWPTEFGWTTAGEVTEEAQARFVREALARAVDEWGGFVERSFLYVLERPHNGDRDGGYSLLRDDGSAKPAWDALAALLATRR